VIPRPYAQLTTLELLSLCVWREAKGEPREGMRAVAHVVRNRTFAATWWDGHKAGDYHAVILDPYQFSSFNPANPEHDLWPAEGNASWTACQAASLWVPCGMDQDNTDGATFYYDTSISWPASWGNQADFINTLNLAHLRFWKLRHPQSLMGMDKIARV
jgi:hypothetical protein